MFARFLSLVLIFCLFASPTVPVSAPAAPATPGDHPAPPFDHTSTGYQAHLAGLEVTFGADGLHANAAGLAWGLALIGLGRSASLTRPALAEIVQAADRIEYRRGSLTEWYR